MTEQVLLIDIDSRGVARLTMNRPELRNCFNEELIAAIADAVAQCNSDPKVRIIVLTGAGKAFSAGADLNMMKRAASYTDEENKADARVLANMLNAIYSSPKPTIALVNGPAIGGGLGLTAACDIAIGADSAFFALTEVRLGLIPAVISPFVIEAIGPRWARRLFVTGERFEACRAQDIGLLHDILPADQLEAGLEALIGELLNCGPDSQYEAKKLIRAVAYQPIDDSILDETAARIAQARASDEGREGVGAFLDKRKPNWSR